MSSDQISIRAPAKLNLRLKVQERRPDGFHDLSMLNATINLSDEICLSREGHEMRFSLEDSKVQSSLIGPDEQNLCLRAARLFAETYQLGNQGVLVKLIKRIPIGAGLGGGSSDAAAVLKGMSILFRDIIGRQLSDQDLLLMAAKLGSDVPFFITGGLCVVKGVGDRLTAFKENPLSNKPFLLVCSGEHSSTAKIYGDYAANIGSAVVKHDAELDGFRPSYLNIMNLISNDLAPVFLRNSSITRRYYEKARSFAGVVTEITGSGSAFFCLPRKEGDLSSLHQIEAFLGPEVYSRILTFS